MDPRGRAQTCSQRLAMAGPFHGMGLPPLAGSPSSHAPMYGGPFPRHHTFAPASMHCGKLVTGARHNEQNGVQHPCFGGGCKIGLVCLRATCQAYARKTEPTSQDFDDGKGGGRGAGGQGGSSPALALRGPHL